MIPLQDIPISVAERVIEDKTSQEVAFLENDRLDAVGYGRSLMPDDEHHHRNHEIDVEVRYAAIHLQSIPRTSEGVQGSYLAQNINSWSRFMMNYRLFVFSGAL